MTAVSLWDQMKALPIEVIRLISDAQDRLYENYYYDVIWRQYWDPDCGENHSDWWQAWEHWARECGLDPWDEASTVVKEDKVHWSHEEAVIWHLNAKIYPGFDWYKEMEAELCDEGSCPGKRCWKCMYCSWREGTK